jgi:HEAT repeat protein
VATLIDYVRTAGIGATLSQALAAAEALPVQDLVDALNAAGPLARDRLEHVARFIVPAHAVSDCALLDYVFINLRHLPGNYRELFAPGVSACPSVAASLRAALLDSEQAPTARGNAARLLGLYRVASDIPLLIDALEGRLATVPTPASDNSLEIRRGAADALAEYPEPDSMDALIRVLADRRQHSGLGWSAARALSAIGGPPVVPPLIAALSSPDPATVAAAIDGLVSLGASEAVPLLVGLLRHPNQRLRSSAARALHQLGDPRARDAMEAALDDRDASVRSAAFSYLAEHGDEGLRDRAIDALQAPERNVREAAVEWLTRFGTEDDVARVRQLIEGVDGPDVRASLASALSRLTFVADATSGTLAEWDAWYEQHRDATRIEWALDGIQRAGEASFLASDSSLRPAQIALPYLARLDDARAVDGVDRAANSRRWAVRIEAARAIATVDRPRGMRLLIREFSGRSYEACTTARDTLNRLTDTVERHDIDCRSPEARAAAAAEWTAAIR